MSEAARSRRRVKMAPVDPGLTIEIEIPGDRIYHYRAIPVTIDVEEQLESLEDEVRRAEENPDTGPRERVSLQLQELDCILRPSKVGDDGPPENVSDLLFPAYEQKKVSAMVIRKLVIDTLTEIRPT